MFFDFLNDLIGVFIIYVEGYVPARKIALIMI